MTLENWDSNAYDEMRAEKPDARFEDGGNKPLIGMNPFRHYPNALDYMRGNPVHGLGRKNPRCLSEMGKLSFSITASMSSHSGRLVRFAAVVWSSTLG